MSFTIPNVCSKIVSSTALAAALTFTSINGAFAARTIRLDPGTVLPVRLNDTLSSSEAQKGDTFTTTLRTTDANDYGLPDGTKIEGRVRGVRPQKGKDPGMLELGFDRIRLPDGHSYAISGSLIGLDNKSVDRRSDGRLVAKPSHRNDRLTYAGYGAGAGLIVGLLTKHSLEDTLIGGLLGYGFGALQKGNSDVRDVTLKPGTELGVRMDQRAVLTTYGSNDNYNDNYSQDNRDYRNDDNGDTYDHRTNADRNRQYTDRRDYGTANPNDRSDIGVMINDRDVTFHSNAQPILNERNVVLVPATAVLAAAHVPYTYNSSRRTLSATGTSDTVRVTEGSSIAIVNGQRRVRMEAPVQRLNGTLYVPLKFLSLATGDDVSYDSGSRTVILNTR